MRLFGKVTHFLHISRCLSYHAPICRPHRLLHGSCKQWKKICSSCVCWQPPQLVEMLPSVPTMIHVHLYSQRAGVFNPSCNVDMLRKRISFSGAPSDSIEASPANVVPVGIIMPEATDGKQLKIVIVPMDLANTDVESLRSTLEALNQLRKHAHEIEAFTNSMMEDLRKESKREIQAADEEQTTEKTKLNFFEGYIQGIDAVASPTNNISTAQVELAETATLSKVAIDADVAPKPPSVPYTPNIPVTPSQTPLSPNTAPGTMPPSLPSSTPLGDPKETQICADVDVEPEIDATASAEHNLDEAIVSNEPKVDQISIEVPDSLGQRLNDMAISSMHLSFEMDMTNVRDAILNGNDNSRANITLGDDALVFLETKVEADPENTPAHTVPLRFNALIKGTVQIDTGKLNPEHLSDELLPEYNDTVTSIAASICSTALQRGFGPEMQESFVDAVATTSPAATAESNAPVASSKMSAQARMAMRRNHAQKRIKQEHSRPTMSTHAMPEIEEVPSQTPLLKDGCKYPVIKPKKKCPKKCPLLDDPCKESPCKRPKDPKKSNVKKAEKTVQITASSKKGGKGNKKDPCAKDGGKGDKKKKDPCAKKDGKDGKGDKKKDPCAKFKKGGKDGKKKDPCAKKDGKDGKGDKKKDPCAKFKKGDKDGKKKDPCAKKDDKKDPCAKKDGKDGKGDKKKDPCAKFKKGGKDGKKKDPCAKKDKKKDPCAKKDGKGDKKKKDPCAKKNGKGDKKKKDPCAKFKKDDKKDPCKKKFSTSASPVSKFYSSSAYRFNKSHNPKRFMSTAQKQISETSATSPTNSYLTSAARFATYSTLMRRRYGGMPSVSQLNAWNIKSQDVRDQIERCYSKKSSPKKSKNVKAKNKKDKKEKKLKSKDSSKCQAIAPKAGPKDRKHIKARTALRTDCYGKGSEEDCPKSFCGAKCGTVPFPRKKCARDNPKPKKLETFKKPEKKLPPICYKMKGGPKSKKQPKPKGKGRNK